MSEKISQKNSEDLDLNISKEFISENIKVAHSEHKKNGGPYTKQEQEDRRREVFRLHFEKSYSAIRIAEILNVNRNTINEDIKHCYSQLSEEIHEYDIRTWTLRQYQRMESQRNRLLGELEKQENFHDKITAEKMLFELDKRISQFVSPIINHKNNEIKQGKSIDDIIKEISEFFVLNEDVEKITSYDKNDLLHDIIKLQKCDLAYARQIFARMEELGFELCKFWNSTAFRYNLVKFIEMRGFLSDEKLKLVYKRITEKVKLEMEEEEREKKFIAKYGDMSKWTDEIWGKYESDDTEP